MDPTTIPKTSTTAQLRDLEARISRLGNSDAEPGSVRDQRNRTELDKLYLLRAGWQLEQARLRDEHIEHARKMWRLHASLAGDHYARMVRLLRGEQGERVIVGGEPSSDGNGTH